MVRLRILLVLVPMAVVAFAACGEDGPRPDAVSQRLLDRYEIQPAGATTTQQIEVGAFAEDGLPWEVYLAASQGIGLDFSAHFGEPAEVHTTPVDGGAPGMRLHVLVLDGGGTIGAWLSSEDAATGGAAIYPLDDPP
jgi:hypothetical protein